MQLTNQHLLGLPVYTVSQQQLGAVVDMTVDTESHQITHYHVKTRRVLGETLLVSVTQVVSLTNEKMTVDDAVTPITLKPSLLSSVVDQAAS